jgi:sulfite reductase beta subunit-like hemoprotein
VQVVETKGRNVCMDAVTKIHAMKLEPKTVSLVVSNKGVYVDDRKTKALMLKVRWRGKR